MMLTEFLLARVAEDEAATATASTPFYRRMFNGWHRGEVGGAYIGFTDRFTPERVLAECEAKRSIVFTVTHLLHSTEGVEAECEGILLDLALPYADHPDYRQEWKP